MANSLHDRFLFRTTPSLVRHVIPLQILKHDQRIIQAYFAFINEFKNSMRVALGLSTCSNYHNEASTTVRTPQASHICPTPTFQLCTDTSQYATSFKTPVRRWLTQLDQCHGTHFQSTDIRKASSHTQNNPSNLQQLVHTSKMAKSPKSNSNFS
jgi:hypothetical protein